MSKLRNQEHVTLNEIYLIIIQSPEIRKIKDALNQTDEFALKQNPSQLMKRNMEFLKSVLIKSSSLYVIQEDRIPFSTLISISLFKEDLL